MTVSIKAAVAAAACTDSHWGYRMCPRQCFDSVCNLSVPLNLLGNFPMTFPETTLNIYCLSSNYQNVNLGLTYLDNLLTKTKPIS